MVSNNKEELENEIEKLSISLNCIKDSDDTSSVKTLKEETLRKQIKKLRKRMEKLSE